MDKKRAITVLDTFAGAGGFSLGFHLAGAEIKGAIEIDSWASETFTANHPETMVIKKDIALMKDDEILSIFSRPDILLGGPPCQGYSIANRKNGDPKDPRNTLFQEFLRIGRLFSPPVIIMENVPNIVKARTSEGVFVVDIIKEELKNLGYFVYDKVLEATDYGVPQIRKRLFIIASKKELKHPFPKATHNINGENGCLKTPTLWDAISDLPEIQAREGSEAMNYHLPAKNEYQMMLRERSNLVFNHKAMNHSKRLVERFSSMSWGQSTSDVPEHLKPMRRNGKEISDKVYDQNNRRMHPDKPCHTIAASFYANFVHPNIHRNFTAREGARIQSFPDWYVFKGKPTVVSHKLLQREGRTDEKYLCQYNQIGNAVPPLLSQAIAENIFKEVFDE
ncbi:DNA cytosine methyltransferase [Erwinia tracheiphila]|uniref:Cytosine-specific methyltransferase n=1 Tax=Erwinia tracheiphila TaxID=65700 RepID=A0A0M2KLM0_9GAMM|nr:DNA cytosine methyltransferase [Erwinia tracheiphila]AXF77661.1 DNA (cytosine-5-)-methyltransferase [Erwinia tracheiphila]EOS94387.1 DNA-cytosine methyltransferase [Erwinia tracheiphila PSU-1]KKF37891.1 DNA methyltransferase [Erwinia tracheiphila]UIA83652.1 DNA cytosine methyltransferase [Erwinia tracheiphila]UIA88048.1 DNA cytosine methyltransferase [Erwinia tracheiphila]